MERLVSTGGEERVETWSLDDDDNGRYRTESIKFPDPLVSLRISPGIYIQSGQHDSTLRRIQLSPFLDLSRAKCLSLFLPSLPCVSPCVYAKSRSIRAQYRILSLLLSLSLSLDFFFSACETSRGFEEGFGFDKKGLVRGKRGSERRSGGRRVTKRTKRNRRRKRTTKRNERGKKNEEEGREEGREKKMLNEGDA